MSAKAAEPNAGNDEIDMIWGAKAIGARLNLSPREAFYQLEVGRIPGARKWGRKWSASSLSKMRHDANPLGRGSVRTTL
jgi:hypothetical protein